MVAGVDNGPRVHLFNGRPQHSDIFINLHFQHTHRLMHYTESEWVCVCLAKIAAGIIQIFVSVPAYYSISTLLFITESIYWMHSPQIMFHVSNWQLGIGNMTCLFAMELILYSIRRKLVKSLVNLCDVMWFEWRTDHTRTITITCEDIQITAGPLKYISSLCSIVCAVSRKLIKHGLSYFLWTNSQGWVTFMEVQDWS